MSVARSEDPSKKESHPQVVKLNLGFKLAEKWVNSMTKTTENESTRVVLEPRPARNRCSSSSRVQSRILNDPVERRLRAKLNAQQRRVADKESALSANDETRDESSDEESESRTKTFVKKRPASSNSSLQPKKKNK